jgi:hypothetical protein
MSTVETVIKRRVCLEYMWDLRCSRRCEYKLWSSALKVEGEYSSGTLTHSQNATERTNTADHHQYLKVSVRSEHNIKMVRTIKELGHVVLDWVNLAQ